MTNQQFLAFVKDKKIRRTSWYEGEWFIPDDDHDEKEIWGFGRELLNDGSFRDSWFDVYYHNGFFPDECGHRWEFVEEEDNELLSSKYFDILWG